MNKAMTMRRILGCLAWLALAAGSAAQASTTIYYHNDLLGSPVVATNASGQVIWRESYRPYGERLTNDANAAANKMWFTSRRQDAETGLVYMGARFYEPVTGRFLSTDPKLFDEKSVHSFNRYAYANNNPYRYVDPNGRNPALVYAVELGAWMAVGALMGGSTNAVMQVLDRGRIDNWTGVGGVLDAAGDAAPFGIFGFAVARMDAGAAAAVSAAEKATAKLAIDPNKFNHIFGQAEHNLGGVVQLFGSQEKAFEAIKLATENSVRAQKLSGVFETVVKVGDAQITVRGAVVEGETRIGTAFIP